MSPLMVGKAREFMADLEASWSWAPRQQTEI